MLDRAVAIDSGDPLVDVAALARWARRRGVGLPDLEVRRQSLEDVYLALAAPAEGRV